MKTLGRALVLTIAGCGGGGGGGSVIPANDAPAAPRYVSDLKTYWSHGTAVGSGSVSLTHAPMNPAKVANFAPYGLVAGAHVTPIDHQYFYPLDNAGTEKVDVMAAADGHIVHIQHRQGFPEEVGPYHDDFRIAIEHTGTFWTYFDLVTELDPAIVAAIGSVPGPNVTALVRIPVAGGQAIGKVVGQSLDFAVVDTEVTLPGFLVPEHYSAEPWKVHTVDPFDYFVEPVRSQILALNLRTAAPRGGKIDYDVDGRLIGNWFLEGQNGYGSSYLSSFLGHLAIFYHAIDTRAIIVSVGDWQGLSKWFLVTGNAPAPEGVSESSGPIAYELVLLMGSSLSTDVLTLAGSTVQGTILLQVLPNRKLRMETFPGAAAASIGGFTAAARIYER